MSIQLLSLLTVSTIAVVGHRLSALTNEAEYIINLVNGSPDSTWQATDDNLISGERFNQLMGVLPRNGNAFKLAPIQASIDNENVALPRNFDARKRWPKCLSLLDSIKDQSNCGSCWLIEDRRPISSSS